MKHLKVGDPAPEWKGKDQDGKDIAFSDYLGKKLAVYFYPRDSTPTCTVQACNIRDNWEILRENKIQVVGVSADTEQSHQKFIQKFSLPFPLVSDENKEMILQFGVWGEKKFMGKTFDGIHRTTFVMDETGIIQAIIDKPKSKDHVAEIIKSLK